jgi:hypothetical protein
VGWGILVRTRVAIFRHHQLTTSDVSKPEPEKLSVL